MGSVVVGEGPTTYLLAGADPFDVLLGVPYSKVPDSSPRASGGVRALPLRACRGLFYTCLVGIGVCFLRFRWVRASAPAGCSPRAPRGVKLLLRGLSPFLRLSE